MNEAEALRLSRELSAVSATRVGTSRSVARVGSSELSPPPVRPVPSTAPALSARASTGAATAAPAAPPPSLPPRPGAPPLAIAAELDALREKYRLAPAAEVLEQLLETTAALRKAEAANASIVSGRGDSAAELARLRATAEFCRREMRVRSHATRIDMVNATLRRLLLEGASPQRVREVERQERHAANLGDSIDERDERIAMLEREVASLRSLQAEAMRAFDGGRAGELAATKAHVDMLEQQLRALQEENRVVGGEVLSRLEERLSHRAGDGGELALKFHNEAEALRAELQRERKRREEAEGLVGKLLAESVGQNRTGDSFGLPSAVPHGSTSVESRRWSPVVGRGPRPGTSPTTAPVGYRSVQPAG